MNFRHSRLSLQNIKNRPGKSAALIALAALLTCAIFTGSLMIRSLNRGLTSLEARMGADIMVVPFEATTKSDIDLENIVLLGNMGYFYMDHSIVDKIASREGVEQISTQYYLSTVSAGCCSVPVQIIGFDPATDFTITPWIKDSYGKELQDNEIVVGHKLNAFPGDTLTFYGKDVSVAAKLEETGTDLDTAVYTNVNTIRTLIQASVDLGLNTQKVNNPDKVVSCVLVNAADGYSVDDVCNDINIHVRKVKAFRTTSLMEGIASSLSGVSRMAAVFSGLIWLFALVLLAIAFTLSVNGRRKEFALLRTLGASAKKVTSIVAEESLVVSLLGAVTGVLLGALVMLPFSSLIEQLLDLPFLLPSVAQILLTGILAILAGTLAGALAGMAAARRASVADAGIALRDV